MAIAASAVAVGASALGAQAAHASAPSAFMEFENAGHTQVRLWLTGGANQVCSAIFGESGAAAAAGDEVVSVDGDGSLSSGTMLPAKFFGWNFAKPVPAGKADKVSLTFSAPVTDGSSRVELFPNCGQGTGAVNIDTNAVIDDAVLHAVDSIEAAMTAERSALLAYRHHQLDRFEHALRSSAPALNAALADIRLELTDLGSTSPEWKSELERSQSEIPGIVADDRAAVSAERHVGRSHSHHTTKPLRDAVVKRLTEAIARKKELLHSLSEGG